MPNTIEAVVKGIGESTSAFGLAASLVLYLFAVIAVKIITNTANTIKADSIVNKLG